jgi:hypothetical protein
LPLLIAAFGAFRFVVFLLVVFVAFLAVDCFVFFFDAFFVAIVLLLPI